MYLFAMAVTNRAAILVVVLLARVSSHSVEPDDIYPSLPDLCTASNKSFLLPAAGDNAARCFLRIDEWLDRDAVCAPRLPRGRGAMRFSESLLLRADG
jgi:hypothetical protein